MKLSFTLGIALLSFSAFAGETDSIPMQYAFPRSTPVEWSGTSLGRCLAVAAEHARAPLSVKRTQMNKPYDDNEFFSYLRGCFSPLYHFTCTQSVRDKANGEKEKASTLYQTGHEEQLKSWVLSQADNSVSPVTLFEQAIRIENGNVWNALVAVHDLVRNNARFFDSKRYSYKTTVKDSEAFFNKLVDIRGTLLERGKGFGGDHTGSWYRMWGVMLGIGMTRTSGEFSAGFGACEKLAPPDQNVSALSKAVYEVRNKYALLKHQGGAVVMESRKIVRKDETDLFGKIVVEQKAARAGYELFNRVENGKISDGTAPTWEQCTSNPPIWQKPVQDEEKEELAAIDPNLLWTFSTF